MSAGVAFGREMDLSTTSDADLLAGLVWSAGAENELQRAAQSGDVAKFLRAWSKRLASRVDRRAIRKRNTNQSAQWPWSHFGKHPAKQLWTLLEKEDWPRLSRWAIQQSSAKDAWKSERTELELLALADWFLSGPRVASEFAWPVWRLVLTRTLELAAYLAKPLTCELTADRRLLVTGELPWLLGHLFGEIEGVTAFKQLGQQSLRNELIELTDGDGTPAANLLPVLPRWLASFVRSVEIGEVVNEPLLEGEARFRFEDLVTKSVALLDRNGQMLCAEDETSKGKTSRSAKAVSPPVAMLLRASDLASLDELSLAAESLRFRQHIANGGAREKFHSETFSETPEDRLIVTDTDLPATQSDWASWACLRNWWHATANTVIAIRLGQLGLPPKLVACDCEHSDRAA